MAKVRRKKAAKGENVSHDSKTFQSENDLL